MDAVETAEKPAVTVHVRVQVDEWQENSAFSIDQIEYKISDAGNGVLRTMLISSFSKNSVFSRCKNLRQLLFIACSPHLTVMIAKDKRIGNPKTIQKR